MADTSAETGAADWLLREMEGLDAPGIRARDAWLAQDAAHRAAWTRLQRGWQALDGLTDDADVKAMRSLALEPRPHRAWRPAALAASLVACVGAGAWWSHGAPDAPPVPYASAHGQTREVALADGSQITLDADSAVTVTLSGARRAITLERGQAYFRVAHDAARPFVVTAGSRAVVALGTQFDVKRDGQQVAVALTQGRVRVGPTQDAATMRPDRAGAGDELAVGQTLVYDAGAGTTFIRSAGADAAADWRQGRLHFDHTPLAQALADFNRYAHVPIALGDAHLGHLPVSGVFRVDNADGFVRAVALLFPLRVERRADRVVLSPRG